MSVKSKYYFDRVTDSVQAVSRLSAVLCTITTQNICLQYLTLAYYTSRLFGDTPSRVSTWMDDCLYTGR